MMVDYLIHLKLTCLHLQIVFCIARQVKQLKILIFSAAILKNVFLKKMLNTYKLAYIGFEISTLKLTRIH